MGGDPAVAGVPAYLHLHLLLLPRAAKRPKHHPQEPVHQPLHRRVPLPRRHQQGRPAGKNGIAVFVCERV